MAHMAIDAALAMSTFVRSVLSEANRASGKMVSAENSALLQQEYAHPFGATAFGFEDFPKHPRCTLMYEQYAVTGIGKRDWLARPTFPEWITNKAQATDRIGQRDWLVRAAFRAMSCLA